MKEKRYISPFNRNSDDLEGSGISNGAYPPPKVRSFPCLIAGVLSAAAFVAAPSAASAQLQLTVLALEPDLDRITLSISGTLSGGPPTASNFLSHLSIQGPGEWFNSDALSEVTFSGSQPLAGVNLSESLASGDFDLGSRIRLAFASPLVSGTTRGSGGSFTVSDPRLNLSGVSISDLRLHWGFNTGQTTQPFGVFQSNAVVPEPSAYAALLGLAALGCVALRRRAL